MEPTQKVTLAATKSVPLHIPKGYYAFWTITTQAAFTIHFNLKDSVRSYFNGQRSSQNIQPPLSQAYARIEGDNLELIVTINQSQRIDARMSTMDIQDGKGQLISRTVTIVGEDSTDMDYNDIFFTLTAWRTQG